MVRKEESFPVAKGVVGGVEVRLFLRRSVLIELLKLISLLCDVVTTFDLNLELLANVEAKAVAPLIIQILQIDRVQ